MILDVGCGTRKAEPGAVGIDVHPGSAADIVWNLDEFPWPLDSDAFDRVHMSHVIEHVRDVTRIMAEIHRLARNGADVFIVTPHFSSHNSYTDPTHIRHLAARSFRYFTGEDFATFRGSNVRFSIEKLELIFGETSFRMALVDGWRAAVWSGTSVMRRGFSRARDIRCHLKVRK
jgi:SAM-dependent methyltransferase